MADYRPYSGVDEQTRIDTQTTSGIHHLRTVVETIRLGSRPQQRVSSSDPRDAYETEDLPSFPAPQANCFLSEEGKRYQVAEVIGHGGGGTVFRVLDQQLQRQVACKVLRSDRSGNESKIRRFVHEARLNARLDHPGIVPVLDCGEDQDGRPWFHMRIADGTDLGKLLLQAETDHLPAALEDLGDRVDIIQRVCDAVAYAHEHGVIHQDIKPGNIVIGDYGEVFLLDWGTAIDQQAPESEHPGLVGTPAYMSPEQARREGADERSDVYCLGASLYHLLALQLPVWDPNPARFWQRKKLGSIDPLPASIPGQLQNIVLQAMATDPEQRFSNARSLGRALQQWQNHQASHDLATQAERSLNNLDEATDYAELRQIAALFRLALERWNDNRAALDGLHRVCLLHARVAVQRGDLQLAESILHEADLNDAELQRQIQQARIRQQRLRILATSAIGLGIAALLLAVGILARYQLLQQRHWQTVFRATGNDAALLQTVERSVAWDFTRNDDQPLETEQDAMVVESSRFHWLRGVHLHGDVRLHMVWSWPEQVDGVDLILQGQRVKTTDFADMPLGYTAQVGGYQGAVTTLQVARTATPLSLANSRFVAFEVGRRYHVVLEIRDTRLQLSIDGGIILSEMLNLPLTTPETAWIAWRAWSPIRLHQLQVERCVQARLSSPMQLANAMAQRGLLRDARLEYRQIADDNQGTTIGAQALLGALSCSLDLPDTRQQATAILDDLRQQHAGDPLLNRAESLWAAYLWRTGQHQQALDLAKDLQAEQAEHRVFLALMAEDHQALPPQLAGQLLRGLAATPDIKHLDLHHYDLQDLSPLQGLPLTFLDLSYNRINDLAPLQDMPLRLLSCSVNQIANLSPLVDMPLEVLNLQHNQIIDLSPLAALPLQELNLQHNRIVDLSPLATVPLQALYLDNNQIEDITALQGLPLRVLGLSDNPVHDWSPIQQAPIEHLRASNCGLHDLAFLRSWPLEDLSAQHNSLTSLADIPLAQLENLSVHNNQITSLVDISGAPRLKELDIGTNPLYEIDSLDLPSLEWLKVANTPIRSLPAPPASLRGLDTKNCPLEQLAGWQGHPLNELRINGHQLPASIIGSLRPRGLVDVAARHWQAADWQEVLRAWTAAGIDESVCHQLLTQAAVHLRKASVAWGLAERFQGRRYLYCPGSFTKAQADRIAKELGGHLVSIPDQACNDFLRELIAPGKETWIGLNHGPDVPVWTDGTPFSFDMRCRTQPAHTSDSRYVLYSAHVTIWVDKNQTSLDDGNSSLLLEWDDRLAPFLRN